MTKKQNRSLVKEITTTNLFNIGTIIAHYGTIIDIEDEKQKPHRCVVGHHAKPLVVGDRIKWQNKKGMNMILDHFPRKSALIRKNRYGHIKIMAANIDNMIITLAKQPKFCEIQLNKYLTAAELLHIKPIIIMNKIDLLTEDEKILIEKKLATYSAIGINTLYTSCYLEDSMNQLRKHLNHQTSIFVGQSGTGKSSLIGTCLPDCNIKTGAISTYGQGRHTTSVAKLYHLAEGGNIIDSPGIREFDLWSITYQQLCQSFSEFQPYLEKCRFRNCQHDHEIGCAIKQAVSHQLISQQRFNAFHKIRLDLKLISI